jgi:hypothetical protein
MHNTALMQQNVNLSFDTAMGNAGSEGRNSKTTLDTVSSKAGSERRNSKTSSSHVTYNGFARDLHHGVVFNIKS